MMGLLIVMMGMLMLTAPAQAIRLQSWDLEPHHFFHIERAQHIWKKLKTRAEYESAREQCLQTAYADWEPAFKHGLGPVFFKKLKEHKDRDMIAACFDLRQAFNAFIAYYTAWSRQPLEWNDDSNPEACRIAAAKNVITGRCDDVPDWRTAKDRARDRNKVARIARQRGQDIEAAERLLEAIRNGS